MDRSTLAKAKQLDYEISRLESILKLFTDCDRVALNFHCVGEGWIRIEEVDKEYVEPIIDKIKSSLEEKQRELERL